MTQAAQKQHYVPQFILRQFLVDAAKEQVAVYDKRDDKTFITSTKNIMAERRFNDFSVGDHMASFEPIACRIEDQVLPVYERILETRTLDKTPETRSALALLIAFQFLRSKAHRNFGKDINEGMRARIEAMGFRMEDIDGWEEQTEEVAKREHLVGIVEGIDEFSQLIAAKDFALGTSPAGRSFYLGDCPVCLSNQKTFGPYGNIGFALPGIEIYMPLAADLLLCAWCPSIMADGKRAQSELKTSHQREVLARVMAGDVPASEMKLILEAMAPLYETVDSIQRKFDDGVPVGYTAENMDYINSLQTSYAHRYVVCQKRDFSIARRHNKEFPQFREGRRPHLS